jgi:predicted transcriptional regulator
MAYRLLIILFGWCGNRPNKKVNVTSFATQLCITRRTAQRYLAELRDLGIIITTHAKTRIGMIEGIFVIFNPLVRQCFPKNTNFDAENRRKKDVKQISQLTKNFTHGTSKKTHINININLKRGNSGFT